MRRNLVVAGWAGAAAVAVAAGVGAVVLAQGGTLSPPTEPMSEDEVLAELESARAQEPSTAGSSPSASPSPEPSGELDQLPQDPAQDGGTLLDDTGGSVLARCADGGVELVWWVADQGWRISSVDPGPDEDAEIEFEGAGGKADWNVHCSGGTPRAEVELESDDD